MRNLVRLILVGAFAAGMVAATTVGAGAGAILRVNKVTVVKVVHGPVTPDTTFTVGVDCTQLGLDNAGTTAAQHTDITFDSTGQPTSADTVSIGAGVACTATETVNGGAASTTYACDIERGVGHPGRSDVPEQLHRRQRGKVRRRPRRHRHHHRHEHLHDARSPAGRGPRGPGDPGDAHLHRVTRNRRVIRAGAGGE